MYKLVYDENHGVYFAEGDMSTFIVQKSGEVKYITFNMEGSLKNLNEYLMTCGKKSYSVSGISVEKGFCAMRLEKMQVKKEIMLIKHSRKSIINDSKFKVSSNDGLLMAVLEKDLLI